MTGHSVTTAALGMEIWEYYKENPEEGATFAGAMGGLSASVSAQVATRYDASRFARIVDVGGSQGVLLAGLLAAAPQATGVLFDRPEVIDKARPVITARGLAGRMELVGGDFFTEVPSGGDLYVLKSVLHDWDDDHALRILANCHRAAQPGSTLLLVEGVLPTEPQPSPIHLINLYMFLQVDGRERTREEHQALLEAAGYRLERVIPPAPDGYHPWSLLEARRN
jgi:SAM-dependent methyltransferase